MFCLRLQPLRSLTVISIADMVNPLSFGIITCHRESVLNLDYDTLHLLRQNHPAWRLLRSDHAPLIAAFLQRVFIIPNLRVMPQNDLLESLRDELFALHERLGAGAFPRPPLEYLNEWASNDKGWLRKFYARDSDEPYFDLTPAAEKAISWLGTLAERSFVGTESRLLTLFELLKQMNDGSESNPQARLEELYKRRNEIDTEIARVEEGDIRLMDDTALKDRFQQFAQLARELLADFREVEHNFRSLDRHVRERIALWEGNKGDLLEEIMGKCDLIADSDQGRSFRAFWDFLMSSRRQEELSGLLERVLTLPPVTELKPDPRTRRLHYDWLEAGEHTQRTVAQLSQQLRRFLDDQAWLENRRIMDILHSIEAKALSIRETPPPATFTTIEECTAAIEMPMERPLFTPKIKPVIIDRIPDSVMEELDLGALFSQTIVDRTQLARNIQSALQERQQISLAELCAKHPLRHGLAELLTYIQISGDDFQIAIDENNREQITWRTTDDDGAPLVRPAGLAQAIFLR